LALSSGAGREKIGATNIALDPSVFQSDDNRPVAAVGHAISRRFASLPDVHTDRDAYGCANTDGHADCSTDL
jgi:hypothetical protein